MPTEPNKPNAPRPPGFYRVMALLVGPLEHLFGLGCRSYTRLSSDKLERKLTFREKLVCGIHRLICSICRTQNRHNEHLHELFKIAGGDQKFCDPGELSAEAKEKMRNKLAEELKDGPR